METRCRLCFEERAGMERIFDDNYDEEDIDYESQVAIKIFKCTAVQLPVDDDDLGSQVCKECLAKLDEFFQFRVTCRNNNLLYCKRKQPLQTKVETTKTSQSKPESIETENDDLSLEKLDETLLRALEGKDVAMDPSNFDETFGSEVNPEDLLKISIGFEEGPRLPPEEVVSSSSSRCSGCGSEFPSQFELKQHLEYCPSQLKVENFNLQMPNVTAGSHITCYICNKNFPTLPELKIHEAQHTSSSMKCNFCLQTFTCTRTLKFHMDQHKMKNTLPDGRFKCDLCDATFKLYGNLIIHRRSHTGERPYPCSICGRAFSTSSNMKTHMNVVHSQDRPFKCQQCYKSFNSESRLRSHVESHTFGMAGPTTFGSGEAAGSSDLSSTCKICHKSFSHPSYLTIHYRVHTGERPYQCMYCSSAFATSGNLKVHMRIHASQKVRPYKCNICTKSFLHASNLSVHKKTQHY